MVTVVVENGQRMRLNLHCQRTRADYLQLLKHRYRQTLYAFRMMMEAAEKLLSSPTFLE